MKRLSPAAAWTDAGFRAEVRRIASAPEGLSEWLADVAEDEHFRALLVAVTWCAPHPTPAPLVAAWAQEVRNAVVPTSVYPSPWDDPTFVDLLDAAGSERFGLRPALLALLDLESEWIRGTLRRHAQENVALFRWCLASWPTDLGRWVLDRFAVPKDERFGAMGQVSISMLKTLYEQRPEEVRQVLQTFAKSRDSDLRGTAIPAWLACIGYDDFARERIAKERDIMLELRFAHAVGNLVPALDTAVLRELGSLAGNAPRVTLTDGEQRLRARGYAFDPNAEVPGPLRFVTPAWTRRVPEGDLILVVGQDHEMFFVDAVFPHDTAGVRAMADDVRAVFYGD